jgi:hypothetical protein
MAVGLLSLTEKELIKSLVMVNFIEGGGCLGATLSISFFRQRWEGLKKLIANSGPSASNPAMAFKGPTFKAVLKGEVKSTVPEWVLY